MQYGLDNQQEESEWQIVGGVSYPPTRDGYQS